MNFESINYFEPTDAAELLARRKVEAGLQNLTQDVGSCLVHFGTDTTQTWLLVRLKQPEMPKTPQAEPVADDSK